MSSRLSDAKETSSRQRTVCRKSKRKCSVYQQTIIKFPMKTKVDLTKHLEKNDYVEKPVSSGFQEMDTTIQNVAIPQTLKTVYRRSKRKRTCSEDQEENPCYSKKTKTCDMLKSANYHLEVNDLPLVVRGEKCSRRRKSKSKRKYSGNQVIYSSQQKKTKLNDKEDKVNSDPQNINSDVLEVTEKSKIIGFNLNLHTDHSLDKCVLSGKHIRNDCKQGIAFDKLIQENVTVVSRVKNQYIDRINSLSKKNSRSDEIGNVSVFPSSHNIDQTADNTIFSLEGYSNDAITNDSTCSLLNQVHRKKRRAKTLNLKKYLTANKRKRAIFLSANQMDKRKHKSETVSVEEKIGFIRGVFGNAIKLSNNGEVSDKNLQIKKPIDGPKITTSLLEEISKIKFLRNENIGQSIKTNDSNAPDKAHFQHNVSFLRHRFKGKFLKPNGSNINLEQRIVSCSYTCVEQSNIILDNSILFNNSVIKSKILKTIIDLFELTCTIEKCKHILSEHKFWSRYPFRVFKDSTITQETTDIVEKCNDQLLEIYGRTLIIHECIRFYENSRVMRMNQNLRFILNLEKSFVHLTSANCVIHKNFNVTAYMKALLLSTRNCQEESVSKCFNKNGQCIESCFSETPRRSTFLDDCIKRASKKLTFSKTGNTNHEKDDPHFRGASGSLIENVTSADSCIGKKRRKRAKAGCAKKIDPVDAEINEILSLLPPIDKSLLLSDVQEERKVDFGDPTKTIYYDMDNGKVLTILPYVNIY